MYSQDAQPEVIDVSKSLGPLIEAALDDPRLKPGTIKEDFAKAFKLPFGPDDLWTYDLAIDLMDHHKAIYIRPTANGRAYIFLVATDDKSGFFYHTTIDGKLIHAIFGDGKKTYDVPHADAKEGFETELAYWRKWLADKDSKKRK